MLIKAFVQKMFFIPKTRCIGGSFRGLLFASLFPDSVWEKLLPVIRNRYITTFENISYK